MNEILLLLILLVLSGFFSGAEIAFFSLGAERIKAYKNQVKTKKQKARVQHLENLKAHPNKLLVTILIGNNIVNVASSAIATLMGTKFATTHGFGDDTALVIGVVTGVMTFLLLLFGEITPKALAHKHAMGFAILITPIIRFLQILMTPIVIPLSLLVQKFSGDEVPKHGLSEDELKAALELSEKDGQIEQMEKEWVEKILEFGEHSVESIMTPRSKIFAFSDDTSVKEVLAAIQDEKFSRMPIYHEDLDNTIGVLTVHALLEKGHTLVERGKESSFLKQNVANLRLLKPFKIPITMKIDTLLKEFQSQGVHIALVYDEHGGVVGLITMEDLLEEIFGEIRDEQDEIENPIRQIGKQKFLCQAEIELEQLENFVKEALEKKAPEAFPWTYEEENKTLGLFILEKLEKFPEPGESFKETQNEKEFCFKVIKAENEKIEEVEFSIS